MHVSKQNLTRGLVSAGSLGRLGTILFIRGKGILDALGDGYI